MAAYGTKEYYEEKVREAEMKVELLCCALVHKIKESDVMLSADKLRNACKIIIDACDEADAAEERYNVYCGDERSSKEST